VKASFFRYRPDIDGLRAVAIVPVVFYHAGITPFQGGYVGVDVFFVISGYLITSLILSEMARREFTITGFYERRIRRIFPALFVLMGFTIVIGWMILAPEDYKLLGQSVFATTFFASNIFFWRHSGYFDVPASELPLLHTWSLAVEEQFYVFFPVYLLLISRFLRHRRNQITLGICILSFAMNALTVRFHPHAAFFLTSHRIWELLIGALLAMQVLPKVQSPVLWNVTGAGGLGLIFIAVFTFSNSTPFPGFAALLPVAGTAAVIWTGASNSSAITDLLSHRVFVFIGKISYSLYLWHFPLLAFAGYVSVNGLTFGERLATIAVSVLLAVGSWTLIEQPVRRRLWVFGKQRVVFATAAATLCVMAAASLITYRAQGFPGRLNVAELRILNAATDSNPDRGECLAKHAADISDARLCKLGRMNVEEPQFILWGDSHAEMLRGAVDLAALKHEKGGLFAGQSACAPVIDVDRVDAPNCLTLNHAILALIVSKPSITTVILAARWGLWAEGTRYKRENRGGSVMISDARSAVSESDNVAVLSAGLDRTIATLAGIGKTVWLVGPIPEVGYIVPKTLYLTRRGESKRSGIEPSYDELKERQQRVFALFRDVAEKYPIEVIWPHSVLCDSKACEIERGGVPLYRDDNHLTRSAVLSLYSRFEAIFESH
jgi:peptidoglycan/LPS O-acetylase OafA/YrhL